MLIIHYLLSKRGIGGKAASDRGASSFAPKELTAVFLPFHGECLTA